MIGQILLILHIAAGSVSLLTAVLALATSKGGKNHLRAGRVYAVGMTVIFLTAIPLALLGASIFLLLIAVFSFYLVFAGWRFARNRRGHPHLVDWTAVAILGLTGLGMWGYGAMIGMQGDSQWVTLLVFGFIAVALSLTDGYFHSRLARGQARAGKQRIQRHLTNMLAGTIATVTAVTVVNMPPDLLPPMWVWIPWVLPTMLITPLIVWWNFRIGGRTRRTGETSPAQ